MLWQRFVAGEEDCIELAVHTDNLEVIRRMAEHHGYGLAYYASTDETWQYVYLTRKLVVVSDSDEQQRLRANPYGLHIVDAK